MVEDVVKKGTIYGSGLYWQYDKHLGNGQSALLQAVRSTGASFDRPAAKGAPLWA